MNRVGVLTIPLAAICLSAGVASAQYVVVTTRDVNVRLAPDTSSVVVATAQSGDVFVLKGQKGSWYQIGMFSGEYRYLHSSLAKKTDVLPALPSSAASRKAACFDLVRAQDRADKEAQARYPSDVMKEIDYQRILYDRYELPIFRKHGIAPARNPTLITECAKNNWLP